MTLAISAAHKQFLIDHAVDLALARSIGVRSVADGLMFPWRSVTGAIVEQHRPDVPEDPAMKYVWPAGVPLQLNCLDRPALFGGDQLYLIEGTKQHLAAASADPDLAIVGMVGCWGWSIGEGKPSPDLGLLVTTGRKVAIVLDADMTSNRQVWESAEALGSIIRMLGGVPHYVRTPGSSKSGIDDVLASVEPKRRRAALANLLGEAKPALGRKPAAKKNGELHGPIARFFFPDSSIDVEAVGTVAIEELHCMLDDEQLVLWDEPRGCYTHDPTGMSPAVRLLGGHYRTNYGSAVRDHLTVRCRAIGAVMPELANERMLNMANGLLDLETLELLPHNPLFLSMTQLPVEWDPLATCPTYDAWLAQVMPEQSADDLHEVIGAGLDMTRQPVKALMAYGPSRSGKSTLLRILREGFGIENTSAVTLHDIAGDDRFAVANLYGKALNIAADISSAELRDPSIFKRLTGEDPIQANRKFGKQFTFRSRALLAFAANQPPTVSETSDAYFQRMTPWHFPNSYAGRENPAIEHTIISTELPGVARRWIEGLRRLRERGNFRPSDPTTQRQFEDESDYVRRWVHEATEQLDPGSPQSTWTAGMELHSAMISWARREVDAKYWLTPKAFYNRLEAVGLTRAQRESVHTCFNLVVKRHRPSSPRRPPDQGVRDSADGADGLETLAPRAGGSKEVSRARGEWDVPVSPVSPGHLVFDLETCSEEQLWARPDFNRIVGRVNSDLTGPVVVDTDIASIAAAAADGATLVAHNGFAFDFVAVRLDVLALGEADRLRDTAILAMLDDPPKARMKTDSASWRYELSALSKRLGGPGKTDELARLKRRHGGYDMIPTDDPEYLDYCAADVAATVHILRSLPEPNAYARREMRLLGRAVGSVSMVGFRIDQQLLSGRLADQEQRTMARRQWLIDHHGLPTAKKDGKPARSPHRTAEGQDAIASAFASLGIDLPITRTGRPALDKGTMQDIIEQAGDEPVAVELAEMVLALNGEPAAYSSISKYLSGDGRVHPRVSAGQASGRLSIRKPGLTILGKRSPALLAQRDVFLADEDCALFAVDLSQIDARAVAALSGCPDYAEIFRPGRDLHTEVARRLWGDQVGATKAEAKPWRERAKPLSHGYPYGMGVEGLARQAKVSMAEAEAYVDFMELSFPRMHEWMTEVRERARAGELLDNGFGRKMRVTQGREHTQAPALMGQGCARDQMMEGVLRLPLDVVPMLRAIVHDELVFSVPTPRFEEVRDAVLDALQFTWEPPDGSGQEIDIVAEVNGPADRWGGVYP